MKCERCEKECSEDIDSCHTCTPIGAWRKGMDEGHIRAYEIYKRGRQMTEYEGLTLNGLIDYMDDKFDELLEQGKSDE